MTRQELADAVNAHVLHATGRYACTDAHYIGRLERGQRRWPGADYRLGLRAALGAETDAELGLYIVRRNQFDEQVTTMRTTLTSIAAAGVGFLAGLFSFKVKSRWCPACGGWTTQLMRSDEHAHPGSASR